MGSDCNAVVGQQSEHDNPAIIGARGLGIESSRGQWLKQWCTLEDLVITNTCFPKRDDNKVTHIGPNGNRRQIVHFLVDRCFKQKVRDSGSVHHLDLGSGHKALLLRLFWKRQVSTTSKQQNQTLRNRAEWAETDPHTYLKNATKILGDLKLEIDLDDRCRQIEKAC